MFLNSFEQFLLLPPSHLYFLSQDGAVKTNYFYMNNLQNYQMGQSIGQKLTLPKNVLIFSLRSVVDGKKKKSFDVF